MPFAIAGFSKRFPKIGIDLSIGNRKEILAALRDYTLDVAITGRPPEDMDLERRLIGDHPHMIIAPPEHPLARRVSWRFQTWPRRLFLFVSPIPALGF